MNVSERETEEIKNQFAQVLFGQLYHVVNGRFHVDVSIQRFNIGSEKGLPLELF